MSHVRRRLPGVMLALGLSVTAGAQPDAEPVAPLSPRNAGYTIEVALDPVERTLAGRQVLTWRNVQRQPTDELWFHLYWNAWRNDRSTWMLEDRLRTRSSIKKPREGDWSWIEIDAVKLLAGESYGEADLTERLSFAAPDDGNPLDRTVAVVKLPKLVVPGETVQVEMTWRSKIPRTFARTGFRGSYLFIAHWFPKLGVYEADGWNCHQFHAATEYYSDYGVYDVSITLPRQYVLGATGRETDRTENGDGTITHRYYQEDVHAFTWTASPNYEVREEKFQEPGLPVVDIKLMYQKEHASQAERHLTATRHALKYYGTWFGPYPYDHVTVVDPAYGSGASGMEYPTLFTCGTRLFNPLGGDGPESVTVHETGHQFWYGVVGNNEFEHAWLDEGLNTFSTLRVLDVAYGDRILVRRYLAPPGAENNRGFIAVPFPEIVVPRWENRLDRFRESALADDPSTPTYLYHPGTGGNISYSKTALWLRTLERHLGWPTLQRILSTFYERFQFRHPTPEDFFAVANEVSGQDLTWFFDQVHGSTRTFDYAVSSVATFPVEAAGYVERDGKLVFQEGLDPDEDQSPDTIYRSEAVVQRNGEGVFPVDVLMVFEDGSEVRKRWDGRAHWQLFVEERPSKLVWAIVDPERTLMLDLYYTNNSRVVEPAAELPARKWASKWMIWLQDLISTMTFFV